MRWRAVVAAELRPAESDRLSPPIPPDVHAVGTAIARSRGRRAPLGRTCVRRTHLIGMTYRMQQSQACCTAARRPLRRRARLFAGELLHSGDGCTWSRAAACFYSCPIDGCVMGDEDGITLLDLWDDFLDMPGRRRRAVAPHV